MKEIKKYILWFITWILLVWSIAYWANSWSIWELFSVTTSDSNWSVTSDFRLDWENIKDNTVWNAELIDNPTFSLVTANQYNLNSDISYKENIKNLDNSLENILSINWYSYNLKENWKTDIWLIAQEIEKVYPELVNTNEEWQKTVQYINLIAPLIEAIKEQNKKIEKLESQIEILINN